MKQLILFLSIIIFASWTPNGDQDSKITISVYASEPTLKRSSTIEVNLSKFESKILIKDGGNYCLMNREPNKKYKHYMVDEIQHSNIWLDKKSLNDKLTQFISEKHESNNGLDGIYYHCKFIENGNTTKLTIWSPAKGSFEHEFLTTISETLDNGNSEVNDYLSCLLELE
ncbi:hypothetical protein N9242_01385 [Vicingaceae bacterium]|nr:hypothetical protein [Vicingaceae bacterium]